MGVDLGRRRHTAGGQPEGFHRPAQIRRPFRLADGQALAQRGFIDLDDLHTGFLQIHHFVADRQRDLETGVAARLVVAHETPLQDGHRSSQHALDRLVGVFLRHLCPAHGHRQRARHIAEDDRRLDATRTVALHPAVLGEGKAG